MGARDGWHGLRIDGRRWSVAGKEQRARVGVWLAGEGEAGRQTDRQAGGQTKGSQDYNTAAAQGV